MLEVLEVCVFRNVANTKVMVHWHRLNLIYTSLNHWRSIEARFSRWCLPVFSFPGKYNFSSFSSSFGKWVEIFNSRLIAQCCIPNEAMKTLLVYLSNLCLEFLGKHSPHSQMHTQPFKNWLEYQWLAFIHRHHSCTSNIFNNPLTWAIKCSSQPPEPNC